MTDLLGAAGDITLALQNHDLSSASAITALRGDGNTGIEADTEAVEDARAQEAANKFEALLIHNMLKSMRKTTMSEDKSNDRAIYDDMLDEQLADTMMQAGGIGIADQLLSQIREQQGTDTDPVQQSPDTDRLRELATHIGLNSQDNSYTGNANNTAATDRSTSNIDQLRLATNLWGSKRPAVLSEKQIEFVQPLLPHAQRNAEKLGTSPHAILAIAALETGWGQSRIRDEQGNESHNLFGIKATGADNSYATTLTTEYIEGEPQKLQARFKTYENTADAVDGFAHFIMSNPRYSRALEHANDPERFIQELQRAGYATDPRYAKKAVEIMRLIERDTIPL